MPSTTVTRITPDEFRTFASVDQHRDDVAAMLGNAGQVAAYAGGREVVDLLTNTVRASRQETSETMRARHTNLQ
jgi:hypothetical protein